jgi:hypothetical protein
MMIPERDVELVNRHAEPLYATLTVPASTDALPAVILVHGFKGFRNWSFFPFLAQTMAASKMIAVRMDLSLNGMRGTNDRVLDLDAFARNTVTREVDDVHDLVQQLPTCLGEQWNGIVHFVGHSRGAGVIHVVMKELAEAPPDGIRLGRGAAWNGVGTWVRWTPRQRPLWIEAGSTEFQNARTGQTLRMNVDYMYDIEQHEQRIDLATAASVLADRMLYVHAAQDLTVPVDEHHALRERAAQCGPLIVLPNTTHTFGMTHPVARITDALCGAATNTLTWISDAP